MGYKVGSRADGRKDGTVGSECELRCVVERVKVRIEARERESWGTDRVGDSMHAGLGHPGAGRWDV